MQVKFKLVPDSHLEKYPKDVMLDINDKFGEDTIEDYDIEDGKITLSFSKKGSKVWTKVKKELKKDKHIQ